MLVNDSVAASLTAAVAEADRAAEGRWPRICERSQGTAAQDKGARCDHVL